MTVLPSPVFGLVVSLNASDSSYNMASSDNSLISFGSAVNLSGNLCGLKALGRIYGKKELSIRYFYSEMHNIAKYLL